MYGLLRLPLLLPLGASCLLSLTQQTEEHDNDVQRLQANTAAVRSKQGGE
jgi:hypothetical protein